MKTLLIASVAVLVVGCAGTKGTMLDGRVCTFYTDDALAASNLSNQIIESYVNDKDKEKAQLYLATAKLGATALCEMLRAREAVQGS